MSIGKAPPRVLIVDDNPDAAKTLGMWLEHKGHEVKVVTESKDCLEHLEVFVPDVVLLDIAMPAISGYDIAKQIRLHPKFKKLSIIGVSGFADAAHAQRSIDFGFDHYLVKPLDLNSLDAVIACEVERLSTES
jgi:CheY-like chemotaxis protein